MEGKKLIAIPDELHWRLKESAAKAHENIQKHTAKLLSKELDTPHEVEHGTDCQTDNG